MSPKPLCGAKKSVAAKAKPIAPWIAIAQSLTCRGSDFDPTARAKLKAPV